VRASAWENEDPREARPREAAPGLGRRGRARPGARARVPASNDVDYPCLTEYNSKNLN
jgi:hypothetical protein